MRSAANSVQNIKSNEYNFMIIYLLYDTEQKTNVQKSNGYFKTVKAKYIIEDN